MSANALEMMIVPLLRGLVAGVLIIAAGRGLVRMCGAVAATLRPPVDPTIVALAAPEE